jgi:hypothetical protein
MVPSSQFVFPLVLFLLSSADLCLAGTVEKPPDPANRPSELTFTRDIAPIIFNHCATFSPTPT